MRQFYINNFIDQANGEFRTSRAMKFFGLILLPVFIAYLVMCAIGTFELNTTIAGYGFAVLTFCFSDYRMDKTMIQKIQLKDESKKEGLAQ